MQSSVSRRPKGSRTVLFTDQAIRKACLAATVAAAMFAGTTALAADAAATSTTTTTATDTANAPELQEVIVTGSLIARPVAETTESVQVVSSQDIANQGVVNVEQALSLISANVPSQVNIASTVGTFSGGGTYANLRGIGEGRTLILMDGQRLANNAFTGNAVDLSGIPFSAIESIQVLREGASALYGSDAIAGVINFITKKDFQGLEVQANAEKAQRAGGSSDYVNLTAGHGDLANDGYNAMVTASYSKQNELKATQRDFSAAGFYPSNGVTQTNDPGTWPATVIDGNGQYFQPGYPACAGNPYLTKFFGNCAYRYSAATDLLPNSTELSIMATLTKSLPGDNTISLQYLVSRSEVTGWSGPMFYAFGMTPAADPTYYPTAAQLATCWQACTGAAPALGAGVTAVWSDPGNNRYSGYLNDEQRWLLTFAGKNAGWDYKLNANFSQNNNDNRNVSGYPVEAELAPGGVLSNLINPFGSQTAAGQALINSSYLDGVYANGRMKRWSFDGNATHELGDLFNAGTNATFAIGFALEGDNFAYATTPYNTLVQAATGYTNQSIEGARTLQAVFVEMDVPMAKGLDLDVSDRQDRYSDFGLTNNGKLALRYQPFEFLTFRGTASTGFRAPTLYDLYKPNNLSASTSGTMGLGNPFCVAPYSNPEWSQATCNTQGLGLFGGNKTLSPETSQNFDLGVVIQPITDMGITLDYYRINLKNTIGTIPPTAIYGNPTGLASQIVTNSSGTLTPSIDEPSQCIPLYTATTCGYILQNFQNTGGVTTSGVDISVQYQQRTPIGKFHEDLEGTTVTKFDWQEYSGGPTVNLVGSSLGGVVYQPAFHWTHVIRIDWTSPESMFGAGISNRYMSKYEDEFATGPTQTGPMREVGAYSTFNAYISYKPIKAVTAMFGVQNLFDTNPPFTNASSTNFAAGYNPSLTNPLLRSFFLNLKYELH